MAIQQIVLHRTEVLKFLQHILELRTAVNRSFDRYYQADYDGIEDQSLTIKSEIGSILAYFELEHQIGIR
jgi:hypothetical protein